MDAIQTLLRMPTLLADRDAQNTLLALVFDQVRPIRRQGEGVSERNRERGARVHKQGSAERTHTLCLCPCLCLCLCENRPSADVITRLFLCSSKSMF
jgi:hypothetical protein